MTSHLNLKFKYWRSSEYEMMDAVKEYLTPKTFGILAYVCSIIHVYCGVVFSGIAIALKEGEAEKFTCYVPPKSTLIYKTQVDKACFLRYQRLYNAPLRFYIFVLLGTWFPIVIAVVYSLWVHRRVQQLDSNMNETQVDGESHSQLNNRTVNVFRLYFIHLAMRFLCGVLLTILQHAILFPRGFVFNFGCSLPPAEIPTNIPKYTSINHLNNTVIPCENASDKHTLWVITSVFNAVFAFIIFVEIIRLCRRFSIYKYIIGRESDTKFIIVYLLRKEYTPVEIELISVSLNKEYNPVETELTYVSLNLQQCIDCYKVQVLRSPRSTCLITKSKTDFDELYINLLIHTERAPHKFSKHMERHEIYDVYMEVPQYSICLKDVKKLFYPNKDTKNKCPRKILAVGRPGIGKTVLTEKIIRDWANGVDDFYRDKIAFFLKFRWFNVNDKNEITLKQFLRVGTELSDIEFETIYKEISEHSEKAILIFDGLDEFNGHFDCVDDLPPPNDPDICMSGISLFSKLISGRFLPEATVLVTSRPTANEFYSKFKFDRTVAIIGFTEERIEEYVTKFCYSHEREDHKSKIWNHIASSSDLLHSCYIPVNCFIVVAILFERLQDRRNETDVLPTTLTELYEAGVKHFDKYHFRKLDALSDKKATEELQLLAFKAIEPMQLIFDQELFDEQMKQSGLLNCLSNPYSQAQKQFCFIHLTIQEFLAARHVTQTFSPEEIEEFILSHIESGKWHLVLQFIAGLLGKKIRMFQEDCYKDCVLAFAKRFKLTSEDGVYIVASDDASLLIMRCLREVQVEEIAKEACETTAINDIIALDCLDAFLLPSSDWSAFFYVFEHMKNLKKLDLLESFLGEESYLEVLRLLEQRCVEELSLSAPTSGSAGNIFKALIKNMQTKCSLNHKQCSKLIKLFINKHDLTDENLLSMCEFFKNGHAVCLKELHLRNCEIRSHESLTSLCEVLDSKLCPELINLDLGINFIGDEGLTFLCRTLTKQKLLKLDIGLCSLTNECLTVLCELLRNDCCNLTYLRLNYNPGINDKGLSILCELALTKEDCKLVELDLEGCLLTDKCIPDLRKTLQDEHCKINKLNLSEFTNEGKKSILEIATHENCKARGLKITIR